MTATSRPSPLMEGRLTADAMAGGPPATAPAQSLAPEPRALAAARGTAGPIENKVIAYFQALPEAEATFQASQRLIRFLKLVTLLAGFLGFLAGAATLRTAFGAEDEIAINFHWAIASLLGLNMLTLLLWLLMIAISPRAAGDNSLGAAVLGFWRMGVRRFGGRGGATSRAAAALGRRMGAARIWAASCVSHGLWLAFLLGGVAMALILLSTQQYVFRWETTILDAESYIALTHALAWLPKTIGFVVPDDAAIRAAQWQGGAVSPEMDQRGWASLLFACLLLYGIVPRLVLLALSLWRARRIWRRPLDLSRPEFAALIPHLAPVVEHTRIVSPAPDDGRRADVRAIGKAADLPPPKGPVAVVGWETETGSVLPGGQYLDLGMLDGAAALRHVLDDMKTHKPEIARLVIVADLTATPDRGVTAGLGQLVKAAPEPVMLLTGGAELVDRLGEKDAADRLTDWVAAAHAAGIALNHMTEIDLSGSDAETRRQWQVLTGGAA